MVKSSLKSSLIIVGVLGGLAFAGRGWVVEYLWFNNLDYEPVFWKLLLIKLGLFGGAFAVVASYIIINLWLLSHLVNIEDVLPNLPTKWKALTAGEGNGTSKRLWPLIVLVAFVPALFFALNFGAKVDEFIRFAWQTHVGEVDPIYGNDLGFYLFQLPFLRSLQASFAVLFGLGAVIVGLVAFHARNQSGQEPRTTVSDHRLRVLLVVNFALFMSALAIGFYFSRYDLLLDDSGAVFGAGFVDVRITRWLLLAAVVVTFAAPVIVGLFVFKNRFASAWWSIAGYGGLLFIGLVLVPGGIQRFVVEPNELAYETPYLRHNIALTRRAYGLNDVTEIQYQSKRDLSLAAIRQNSATVDNIRLWDWRPLSETFRQLQQIRTYYAFNDVDVDRYVIDGELTQIMLSARELSYDELPAKTDTWVNRRLQYTHGYGLVMSHAAEMTNDGRPVLLVRDVPPNSPESIPIERPEIYFGEKMHGYRIVDTELQEFDYPKGDENRYVNYQGDGGVKLESLWRRLLFTTYFYDVNIMISSYIGPDSRIQYWRTVQERVSRLAPYLRLDDDPYLVINEGRLFWIQDTYTVASGYPYAEPFDGDLNYVRNSVKAVVDVYNGSVSFYVIDPADPVLRVYSSLFPELFQPLENMPAPLRGHLRYPQGLFEVQIEKLNVYHVTIPQVLYNREDVWTRPSEKYAGQSITMEPYYILMRLPGEQRLQYLMMTPLTPISRDNMIAWVAGRSDFPNYGELIVYKLPKEQLVFGPIQVEATIDQDTAISQRLSLWDQRGSRVIRGNLLVIPIDQSFLYIEPVYLEAEGAQIPQLKRVIVSNGQRVAMRPTLDAAIQAVFGTEQTKEITAEKPRKQEVRPNVVSEARAALSRAGKALEKGNWQEFGTHMDRLKTLLEQ